MKDLFSLDVADFMPHGHCVLWKKEILFPMVGSDILIFLSYSAIPFTLYVFYKKRLDLNTDAKKILLLFVLFIQFCGFTHLISAYNYWHAQYYWELILKVLTALVSMATAFVIFRNLNNFLSLPSPAQYAEANRRLKELNENLENEVASQTEQIRKDKELLESLFKSMDDGVLRITPIKDKKGEIYDFSCTPLNDKAIEQTGISKEQLTMPSMNEAIPDYKEKGRFDQYCQVINENKTFRFDPSDWKINGRLFRAIYTKDSISDSVFLFITNITERENLKSKALANSRLSALGELAGGVAHEINSPLQIISGASRQIKRSIPEVTVEQEESFEVINSTVKRISRIIGNLKRLSHKKSEEVNLIQTKKFLDDTCDFISARVHNNTITLSKKYEERDEFSLKANEVALSQIIMNLVNNAVDALNEIQDPNREKEIVIDIHDDEYMSYIEVRDNGDGIPKEDVDKIFTPLFTSKEVGKGTGLGLSISSKLAEDMGAHLELDQKKGTAFRVVFNKGDQS